MHEVQAPYKSVTVLERALALGPNQWIPLEYHEARALFEGIRRLEVDLAEARRDSERLNWLEKHAAELGESYWTSPFMDPDGTWWMYSNRAEIEATGQSIREVIDHAISGGRAFTE